MESIFCPACRLQQPTAHAYCVRCGSTLPTHLIEPPAKRVRYFAGVKVGPNDPENAFLKASCYLRDQVIESPDGSVTIPGHHVRFSVWVKDEARCVLSIPETEARDLAAFLTDQLTTTAPLQVSA